MPCGYAAQAASARGCPDILHTHDWQTALLPLLKSSTITRLVAYENSLQSTIWPIKAFSRRLATDIETSNVADADGYAGIFRRYELCESRYSLRRCSHYSQSIVRQGNRATKFGEGLDTFISAWAQGGHPQRHRHKWWNPEEDRQIERTIQKQFDGKFINRKALAHRFGLRAGPATHLWHRITFAHQKGLDIVADLIPNSSTGSRIVIWEVETRIRGALRRAGKRFPKHVGVKVGFDAKLAHQIEAGADAFVMPSRYEPCGLSKCTRCVMG